MRTIYFLYLLVIGMIGVEAQNYSASSIPSEIKEDSKAVVLLDDTKVVLKAYDKMEITRIQVVTIFKPEGDFYRFMPMHYDKFTKIKEYGGYVYDANGSEIKKFKRKDYEDRSAVGSSTLYADDRLLIYNYKPTTYPYTIKHYYTYDTSDTAFLPDWIPVNRFEIGVVENNYEFINESGIEIRTQKINPELFEDIGFEETATGFKYKLTNFKPLQREVLCPGLDKLVPRLMVTPNKFELAGYSSEYNDWKSFGKWIYHDLIKNRQDLPQEEISYIHELIKDAKDERDKVRILYQYMQNKTRYINVAIGIGGWQPYPAEHVSSKGYGDCKALSNYMMSLLKEAGITSNYTVVYGDDDDHRNINPDFPSMQGNHVILNVPMENDTVWLECTSQKTAFNHLGDFTNDRYALSINQDGGTIVKTQSYPPNSNREIIHGTGKVNDLGNLELSFTNTTSGIQYDWNYRVKYLDSQDQNNWLERRLSHIKNLKIESFEFDNNQNDAIFTQNVRLSSDVYGQISGKNLILPIVPVGIYETSLKKDSYRKLPIQINEGFSDFAEFELDIPEGYVVNYTLEPIEISSEFGTYSLDYTFENHKLKVKRELNTNRGMFSKEKYMDYVAFRRKIEKADKTKILLEKN